MKLATTLRAFFVLALLSLCSLAAYADSSGDPRVIIKDPSWGKGVQEDFSFNLPGCKTCTFSGDLNFTNRSSQTWTSLALFEDPESKGAVSCGETQFFNNCMVYTNPQDPKGAEIVFTNSINHGPSLGGILPCESFSLNFSGDSGGNWSGGTHFTAVAAVPEPTTMVFLFTGIAAIVARRKLWRRASWPSLNTR
jgi:hypothetical protein